MPDRVRIFGRDGFGLSDPRVTAERSWVINEEGEAEFDLTTFDRNCREEWIRFGNWLLIENDRLEPWVGMIDVPQEWKRRYVNVRAYTPERQLIYRSVPKQLKMSGKSGGIFQKIINLVNYAEPTIIQIGEVWNGGIDMPNENLSGNNLFDYIKQLAKRAGAEFSFTPETNNGKLIIKANWHKKIGMESQFPLEESYNLADDNNTLRIQGKINNQLWGYGNGASQSDRPTATITALDSLGKYGLRQAPRTYSDYQSAGSVLNAIRGEINKAKYPRNTFKLSAVDVGNTYASLRQGNSYPLRLWSVGFGIRTRVRMTGAYYNPFRGKVDLILDEVFNDSTG